MPELPEVETVVRTLSAVLQDARIERVIYASVRISRPNPKGWREFLSGKSIASIKRRGKYIIVSFADGGHLVIHLRMTGRFRLYGADSKRQKYDRLVLLVSTAQSDRARQLVLVDTRQFARADLVAEGHLTRHPGIAKLGPEADTINESALRRILARSHRPIKSLLLDQTALAGLGNIYADESLHASGIHPLMPSDLADRGQIRRLHMAMRQILLAATEACGTTFDTFSDLSGEAGRFAPHLRVYGRAGEACYACGSPIARISISGRSAHFCPRCQPA